MEPATPKLPFEVPFQKLKARLDDFVEVVVESLQSDFLILPKGRGFVEYPVFHEGYETIKQATSGFATVTTETVLPAILQMPISLVVLRTILGFTPPEWAYVATLRTGVDISQNAARSLDRRIRVNPEQPLGEGAETAKRVRALVETACALLAEGAPQVDPDRIHRLEKADTKGGLEDVRALAELGVPYPMLLYERFLGRPFAGHKDSVSELVGDSLEIKIEEALTAAGITYRKTKRAEEFQASTRLPTLSCPTNSRPRSSSKPKWRRTMARLGTR